MTPSRPEAPGGPAPRVDQRAGAAPTAPHDDAAPADAEFHDRGLWTIPNLISLLRLLAVPWFLWLLLHEDEPIAAGILLAILGATDWVDGYIARHFDQGSKIGKSSKFIAWCPR